MDIQEKVYLKNILKVRILNMKNNTNINNIYLISRQKTQYMKLKRDGII